MNKPMALQPEESAFIEKTLHYIANIRGAVKTDLSLSTNTSYPRRYVAILRGLPMMTMDDFKSIRDMNDSVRSVMVCMADPHVRMDVWRKDKSRPSKKRRRRHGGSTASTASSWDLSSVDAKDRRCLNILLNRLSAMEGVDCQFTASIDTSDPDVYSIDIEIMDALRLKALESVLYDCRAFCTGFEFDFPRGRFRAKCLRVAAPLQQQHKRRRLMIK